MKRLSFAVALAGTLLSLSSVMLSHAQEVFTGDPVDGGTGLAYPIMPGLPLLLPGDDEDFGTGDDIVNTGPAFVGDVDLVVRAGTVAGPAIPAPAIAPGLSIVTAGGGSSGQGGEAAFTVMVSDGSGSPAYGNVVTNSDLDLRPVTVYAFADLDGDGIIGPHNGDGSADNALEKQEATAYAGRQMGAFFSGVFQDSLGLQLAAPASIGGLTVALVAGGYTGDTAEDLFTDGPLILTRWPLFPPLDPKDLLGGGAAPAPDPEAPNELEWDIETNYLPAPGHPTLGTPFALPIDGSEPTTDQFVVESGAAASARVFTEISAANFLARATPKLRVAPAVGGVGRALVLPVSRAVLAADGTATRLTLRVLPVDLFANVADPSVAMNVTLAMSGAASIVSPDTDANDKTEPLSLSDAEGLEIELDDDGTGTAELTVSVNGAPAQVVALSIGAGSDSDGDAVVDDGSSTSIAGDEPCDAAISSCDDNCPRVLNPSQLDDNHDGIGDCCDGTCIDDPLLPGCDECALPAEPTFGPLTGMKLTLSVRDSDKLSVKLAFDLAAPATISPDAETVTLLLSQAGSGGYMATLASVFTDLGKPTPAFRYSDPAGAVDGVTKAQIKGKATGATKMSLRAGGVSLVDLDAGTVDVTLLLGDDLFEGALACTGSATRLKCSLVP